MTVALLIGAAVVLAAWLHHRRYRVPDFDMCAWCQRDIATMYCSNGDGTNRVLICRRCAGVDIL